MPHTFTTPATDRFFEDYVVGATYECGSFTASEADIVDFASLYDPQAMHVDRAWAATGPFGEVIASGWHTVALSMQLIVRHFLPCHGLAAPGIDELRWPLPVRPGDTLTVQVTVLDARRSRSKPDRGLLRTLVEARTPAGEVAFSMKPINMVKVRAAMPA